MNPFIKLKNWYTSQSDTVKALLWIGIISIIGIIIRWDAVVAGALKGFRFYSN